MKAESMIELRFLAAGGRDSSSGFVRLLVKTQGGGHDHKDDNTYPSMTIIAICSRFTLKVTIATATAGFFFKEKVKRSFL
jgi:hypothetical protein